MALGIGAATTICAVLYSVLLRPLPFAHAERLVAIWDDSRQFGLTPAEFVAVRDRSRSLMGAAALTTC